MGGIASDQATVGEHAVQDGRIDIGIHTREVCIVGRNQNGAGRAVQIDCVVKGHRVGRGVGAKEEFVAVGHKAIDTPGQRRVIGQSNLKGSALGSKAAITGPLNARACRADHALKRNRRRHDLQYAPRKINVAMGAHAAKARPIPHLQNTSCGNFCLPGIRIGAVKDHQTILHGEACSAAVSDAGGATVVSD